MVLDLDHLGKEDDGPAAPLIQPQREAESSEPDLVLSHRQRSDSSASDRSATSGLSRSNLDSAASEKSGGSAFRGRLDSGASDRSQSPSQRGRLDSGASEQSVGSLTHIRQETGFRCLRLRRQTPSGLRGFRQRWAFVTEKDGLGDICYTDSEVESVSQGPASLQAPSKQDGIIDQEQPDGAVLSRKDPANGLLNGGIKGTFDFQKKKMTINGDLPLNNGNAKDSAPEKKVVLEQFNRTNSVRDRMRKFTEATQSASVPALRKAPLRNGTSSSGGSSSQANLSRATEMFTHTGASLGTSGDRPERPPGQWQSSVGGTRHPAEKDAHASSNSKEDGTPGRAAEQQVTQGEADPDMKTFLTIEIKDGRTTSTSTSSPRGNMVPITNMTPRITTNPLGQRGELTLGLRATPFKICSSSLSSGSSIKMKTEPVASEPVSAAASSAKVGSHVPTIPNGSSTQSKPQERSGKLTADQLAAIEDEELLDKMLDESKDFEERKMIRAAMRDLRKRKRDQREKERDNRLQEIRQQREERGQKGRPGVGAGEVGMRKVEKSADGSSLSQVTKTDRFASSDDGSRSSRSTVVESSYLQKTDRGTLQSKTYSFSSSTSSSSSNTSKKVGSVFDREDDASSRSGSSGLAAVERLQAERRKELMRAQSLPKTSAMAARKAMIEKLEKEGGGPGNQAVAKVNKVQRSTSFGVPNANSIKQMLLDWCRAKTRSYEHVDIQNFSSSWSNGMAFCALVHNFFPESFEYESLSPSNRRQNFEVAFNTAEKMVDCAQLLDVDDMVKMREPDWKCVYTYLQEFYRGLVTKGLVKTKNSS
ncbi:hypothetical protein KUCAC02_029337 [Chaenocephalus aceratus]|uniref:Uncharacterized protein n=1 Tax=Chaenocephalus aceratus TaxID=36190 RepID=A0ACB9X5S6_CHAAC|nr:hypothetical protein KUCAC02_029337 [Chaenocephalus aceratus]